MISRGNSKSLNVLEITLVNNEIQNRSQVERKREQGKEWD